MTNSIEFVLSIYLYPIFQAKQPLRFNQAQAIQPIYPARNFLTKQAYIAEFFSQGFLTKPKSIPISKLNKKGKANHSFAQRSRKLNSSKQQSIFDPKRDILCQADTAKSFFQIKGFKNLRCRFRYASSFS